MLGKDSTNQQKGKKTSGYQSLTCFIQIERKENLA